MSLIGNIAGIPLYTTLQEALVWGAANGLSGYHRHNLQGQQGYMGGATHSQAVDIDNPSVNMSLSPNITTPPTAPSSSEDEAAY